MAGRNSSRSLDFMHPSASFSATIRVRIDNQPGAFARLAAAVGEAGGLLGAIDLVRVEKQTKIRDVTVLAADDAHLSSIIDLVRAVEGVEIVNVSDRTFLLHLGGKIEVTSRVPLKTRDDLSMAYTPGVARVCRAIADDPDKVWNLTIKRNTVAVVSDGTAVLGLGDIGPEAAMPVMEGKAVLFKEFGGVDAFPICLSTTDTDEIVRTVEAIAPGFGGINLEDISAPRCFDISRQLQEQLDIPVFHDDQHGTAVVVVAALHNALRLTRQKMGQLRIVISGAGAAGMAVTRMLLRCGARDIIVCDREGAIGESRRLHLNESKAWLAQHTNPRNAQGRLQDVLRGANVFVGVSAPGLLRGRDIKRMAPKPIVFALANPTPEIMPEEAARSAFIVATGRSDYPNQINNVLAFPGIFRGALDVRARQITEGMKLAAAKALAGCIAPRELSPEYIVPSVFNRQVVQRVADAVRSAALRAGVARKQK